MQNKGGVVVIMNMFLCLFGAGFFGILDVATIIIQVTGNGQDSNWIFFIIFSICFALLYYNYCRLHSLSKKEKENEQKTKQEQLEVAFYDECLKNGIKSCKTEKEIQKATLIAQKLNLQFANISALYAESQQRKRKIEQREMEESINSEKNEEQKKYNELIKYANYSGREKRIAMLADMQKKYAEAAKTLRDGASAVWSASQLKEKEGDWAIMGGIASAIAGPAAGMATALDSQAKTAQENAQIRERNRINCEAFAPVIATSYKGAAQNERMAKSYAELLESAKTKLVANDSTEECFARIIFDGTTIDVSRSGTCTVMTSVCASPFKIFDDVPAVIDGTIIAQIYDNNELIGKAKMVLPIYGIQGKKNKVKLTGMALFCGSAGTSYRIEFVPEKLWAMEQ